MKAPRHWPLWGEFTGDRWIPRTKGLWRRKCFHLMTLSCTTCPNYLGGSDKTPKRIMGAMASLITSLPIVYSTVYSSADQRKHQSSASLAFVWGIHRWRVNSPHKRASNAENVSIWIMNTDALTWPCQKYARHVVCWYASIPDEFDRTPLQSWVNRHMWQVKKNTTKLRLQFEQAVSPHHGAT